MQVPLLVDDFLRRPARLYPNKTAIIDAGLTFTYAEYQTRVNKLSNALLALGVSAGERVCILSPNSHFFLESFYATSQIGAILVPLNYRLVPQDHSYIMNHAGVTTLLVDYEYTGMVDAIRDELTNVERWIVAAHDDVERTGWTDWEALIKDASSTPPPPLERDENDTVSINYTSGTTSRPKGVMLTHRNCYINAYSFIAHLSLGHDDVEMWTLPMFHCNGWGGVYALTGMGGTHVVLRAVEGKAIYDLIENHGVTFACMAPAVLRTILDYPDKD
ncbi:MAG: fatty-acyl-CoA synthase, partial [Gammaproteobacteria bacterium]